jgi:DNA-nicking Smr family endonuclease
MSQRRRGPPRFLSEEERRLWETVGRSAEPLGRRRRPDPDAAQPVMPAADEKPSQRAAVHKPPKPDRQPVKTAPLPVIGIDRRTRTQIARGARSIDARLDLHGLTQGIAHLRLRRFLEEAQAQGARLALVITGKGKPLDEVGIGEERGVLRRAVPGWLAGTEFRHLVAGFDEAGRRHGGGGALYVRIKRKR